MYHSPYNCPIQGLACILGKSVSPFENICLVLCLLPRGHTLPLFQKKLYTYNPINTQEVLYFKVAAKDAASQFNVLWEIYN